VLVTTNAGKRIDSAFLRRLDVTIEFALPDAAERRRLWEHHLPAQHAIAPTLLHDTIQHCALSGGQIRNAALYATLIALNSPDGVSDEHLQEALRREYRKAGAAYPLHARAAAPTQLERLQQFTAEIHER
jgi:SpoVK/Ycf46/Vps4 family AAA+-type ATPase